MSWAAYYFGKPKVIIAALKKYSEAISGKSKEEFDAALPHLIGLLEQNFSKENDPVVRLQASGHGSEGYSTCTVNIENLGALLE